MKTIKQVEIIPVWCEEYLPGRANMEPNKLYISRRFHGCSHLCLCGCGVECYLPLNHDNKTDEWNLIDEKNDKISLTPSILQRFDCKSHYIITKNKANFC